jgi:hypothetical protein
MRDALTDGSACSGHVGQREFSLEVAGEERHAFSPRISLIVEPTPNGTHVRGRFGPSPNLWTLFLFLYSLQVAVFVGGTMYGLVQTMLGQQPMGLYAAALACVTLGASCTVDLLGRKRGKPQMTTVCHFIRDTLPELQQRPDPGEAATAQAEPGPN